MTGRASAARARARRATSELITDVLAASGADHATAARALRALQVGGSGGGVTVEQLADLCDRLDYELVLTASPLDLDLDGATDVDGRAAAGQVTGTPAVEASAAGHGPPP